MSAASRRKRRRHAAEQSGQTGGLPEGRRARQRRYSRMLDRGIAAVFVLLIVAGVAACMLIEFPAGPHDPSDYDYLPNRERTSKLLFHAFLQTVPWLMHLCGLSDFAIRIVLLTLLALSVGGIVVIIKVLGRLDPAKRSDRIDGGPVDRSAEESRAGT